MHASLPVACASSTSMQQRLSCASTTNSALGVPLCTCTSSAAPRHQIRCCAKMSLYHCYCYYCCLCYCCWHWHQLYYCCHRMNDVSVRCMLVLPPVLPALLLPALPFLRPDDVGVATGPLRFAPTTVGAAAAAAAAAVESAAVPAAAAAVVVPAKVNVNCSADPAAICNCGCRFPECAVDCAAALERGFAAPVPAAAPDAGLRAGDCSYKCRCTKRSSMQVDTG
jgi:hypothetical protein